MVSDRILTVPNLLSLARLAVLPFLWVDLTSGREVRGLVLLAVFAATDWVDGYVARRFGQVTRLGKVLDPISDRILIAVVGIALVVAGLVPLAAALLVLLRDVVVAGAGLWVLARGGRPPEVTRTGKTATAGVLTALPLFVLAEAVGVPGLRLVAWAVFVPALALYYVAAAQYAAALRRSVAVPSADEQEER